MVINNKLLIILILSILLRFFFVFLNLQNPNFIFLQENYDVYINALLNGSISNSNFSVYESRMFPGYILTLLPFLFILKNFVLTGILLNLVIFSISFYLVWKIFKDIILNLLFAFFPPIWILQTTKVSSEPLTILLLLTSILSYLKKYYLLTGLIIGLAFNVRIISGCLLIAIVIILFFEKKYKEIFRIITGFLITASLLMIYNYIIFGNENLLIQFKNLDQNYGVVRIGFIQIFYDIYRTIDWGQYRILFSGILYLFLNFISVFILFKFRKKEKINKLCFYWLLFSLIFVFSLSPFTLIENFSRYALPALPAVCLAISILIKELIIKFKT